MIGFSRISPISVSPSWNRARELLSLPAGSVPAGVTRDRLPVGLQVVGPRFEEPK
jgi:Asp-tRNA(Asn)/Glu-tRNA(Gln) amidotransferase A subunit family amidase